MDENGEFRDDDTSGPTGKGARYEFIPLYKPGENTFPKVAVALSKRPVELKFAVYGNSVNIY